MAASKAEEKKRVLRAFLRCLSNNGAAHPHIPLHALLVGPVSHFFFSLSRPVKDSPPFLPFSSIRVATCPGAVVATATSPPCHFLPVQSQVHGGVRPRSFFLSFFFFFGIPLTPSTKLWSSRRGWWWWRSPAEPQVHQHISHFTTSFVFSERPRRWKQCEGQHLCM